MPRLASSWSWSPDGRILTFHLRPGVVFHDGAPLTADDVVHTSRRVVDPKSHGIGWLGDFLPIESVEAVDPRTVRVTYRYPYAPALEGWTVPILPRHLDAASDEARARLGRAPVGSGPFRFGSWESGRRIVLFANDDYWNGRPHLDSIEFAVIPSQETTLQALLASEIDYAMLTPVQWTAHAGHPAFDRRFRGLRYPAQYLYYIAWRGDGSNPFFGDARVRRAMALALDREGYVRGVLRGAGSAAVSLFLPIHRLEEPDPPDAGPQAAGAAHPDAAPGAAPDEPDPGETADRFDPAAAGRLLDEAGWRLDASDGTRRRSGVPLRFTLMVFTGAEDAVQFAQVAQETLRSLGAILTIERLDWPTLWSRLRTGRFEAALSGFVPGADPDSLYGFLHSSQVDGGQNYAALRDPRIDAWLEAGRRERDGAARRALYRRVDRRLRAMQPYTPLFTPWIQSALARRVHALNPSPRGLLDQYPGIAAAWVDDAAGGPRP